MVPFVFKPKQRFRFCYINQRNTLQRNCKALKWRRTFQKMWWHLYIRSLAVTCSNSFLYIHLNALFSMTRNSKTLCQFQLISLYNSLQNITSNSKTKNTTSQILWTPKAMSFLKMPKGTTFSISHEKVTVFVASKFKSQLPWRML